MAAGAEPLRKREVSVVVPVYNAERHLRETLDSLAAQDYGDFEVIMVDDGSADGSPAICKEYAASDARFRYVCQENAGAGAARNHGMDLATGEYLLFLDSDDLFEQNLVSTLAANAEESGADVTVCGADSFDSETGATLGALTPHASVAPGVYRAEELASHLFLYIEGRPWDKLFRTDFVRKSGLRFQSLSYSNDTYFVYSAVVAAERVCFLDDVLVHYRVGAGSSLRDKAPKDVTCDLVALDAVYERMADDNSDRFEQLILSFREHVMGIVLGNASRLVSLSRPSAEAFYTAYFCDYAAKWGCDQLRWRDALSKKTLVKYRLWRSCSLGAFAWACQGRDVDRRASASRTKGQKATFALRLIIAATVSRLTGRSPKAERAKTEK